MSKSQTDVETKAETVNRMAEMPPTGLYLLDDAMGIAEVWGKEAVERVQQQADTFLNKGAIPHGDNDIEDEAVGVYQVAQAAVEAEGGESLRGRGTGSGFYARSAYKRNMKRLAELTDGVTFAELDIGEPSSMEKQ